MTGADDSIFAGQWAVITKEGSWVVRLWPPLDSAFLSLTEHSLSITNHTAKDAMLYQQIFAKT